MTEELFLVFFKKRLIDNATKWQLEPQIQLSPLKRYKTDYGLADFMNTNLGLEVDRSVRAYNQLLLHVIDVIEPDELKEVFEIKKVKNKRYLRVDQRRLAMLLLDEENVEALEVLFIRDVKLMMPKSEELQPPCTVGGRSARLCRLPFSIVHDDVLLFVEQLAA